MAFLLIIWLVDWNRGIEVGVYYPEQACIEAGEKWAVDANKMQPARDHFWVCILSNKSLTGGT